MLSYEAHNNWKIPWKTGDNLLVFLSFTAIQSAINATTVTKTSNYDRQTSPSARSVDTQGPLQDFAAVDLHKKGRAIIPYILSIDDWPYCSRMPVDMHFDIPCISDHSLFCVHILLLDPKSILLYHLFISDYASSFQ